MTPEQEREIRNMTSDAFWKMMNEAAEKNHQVGMKSVTHAFAALYLLVALMALVFWVLLWRA